MSFHGTAVITGLFGAIPFIGESVQVWLLGTPNGSIGQPALNRFFSLHYLLPFILLGLTDAVDGMLARRYGGTPLGALLDPVVDKIFLVATFGPLADLKIVAPVLVGLLFIRELAVTALRSTALEKKVKFVDCRIQPNLGHAFPRDLVPYWTWVMEVMEGRFTAGDQRSFEWAADLPTARREMESKKVGGFAYIWSSDADEKETALTRLYQNEALFGRVAGFFGRQLVAVKLEKKDAADLIAALAACDAQEAGEAARYQAAA